MRFKIKFFSIFILLIFFKNFCFAQISSDFPELSCLKNNIHFWKKIYSEVDTNEAVFHDKNNLGRIYGVYKFSSKNNVIEIEIQKKILKKRIYELARKIAYHKSLTRQEFKLSQKFSKQELNTKFLLYSIKNIRVQTGLKSQFKAGINRSINIMSLIFPVVKKSGLPIDLMYLPHVESSYNLRAGSKVGALGLWQLMPMTMRNLEGKEAVYKRTEPKISTQAAMKLLKLNFEKTGNWPLALTAYNHGLNGIERAIEQVKSHNLCTIIANYHSPSFKFASSNFYAQFLAARQIAKENYHGLAKTTEVKKLKRSFLTAMNGDY